MPVPFLEAKAAFAGGMSYVNKAAGELLGNAQAVLGNIVGGVRSLPGAFERVDTLAYRRTLTLAVAVCPGRVIGYIMEFHNKLDEVRQKANAYISKGETFVAVAIQFKDIGATIRRFALEALEALGAKVREVIAKYVAG